MDFEVLTAHSGIFFARKRPGPILLCTRRTPREASLGRSTLLLFSHDGGSRIVVHRMLLQPQYIQN